MFTITMQSNLNTFRTGFLKAIRETGYATRDFLKREEPRIKKHVHEIVKTTVYDIYEPQEYKRTENLLKSMRTQLITPYHLLIDSDPDIAKNLSSGKNRGTHYAPFVAGEGPGIGFLRPFYGVGENVRPSYFPRRFHEHIVIMGSSIYKNLEQDLSKRLGQRVFAILNNIP